MPEDEIIYHLFQEDHGREFLLGICNGVNTWLFKVLSNYRLSTGRARTECLILGHGIVDHLQKIHGLRKHYNDSPESFSRYLAENTDARKFGLNYVIKTILSSFKRGKEGRPKIIPHGAYDRVSHCHRASNLMLHEVFGLRPGTWEGVP